MRVRDDFLIKYLNFIPHWIRPNHITAGRVVLAILLFLPRRMISEGMVLCLVAVGGLSDLIDGVLARKRDQITNFGKIFDPVADKFLAAGILWYLFFEGAVSLNIIIHMILPETILLFYVVWLLFDRRIRLPEPNILARGKFTAYILGFIVLVVAVFIGDNLFMFQLGLGALILGIVLAWASQIVYIQGIASHFLNFKKINSDGQMD